MRQPAQQRLQVLAGHERGWKEDARRRPVADLPLDRVADRIPPAAEVQHAARGAVAQDGSPVQPGHHALELVGAHPGGIEPANDGAHAGSRDAVHRHAVFLEHLQDTDVREAQRPPAAERQAQARPRALRGLRPDRARRQGERRAQRSEQAPADTRARPASAGRPVQRARRIRARSLDLVRVLRPSSSDIREGSRRGRRTRTSARRRVRVVSNGWAKPSVHLRISRRRPHTGNGRRLLPADDHSPREATESRLGDIGKTLKR